MSDPNEMRDQKPFDAATVILTRERDDNRYEIFLMRRHQNMSFMGNAFVFPGGRLDPGDCDPDLVRKTMGQTLNRAPALLGEPGLSAEIARGLFFTAIRETFEEAGILLAGSEKDRFMDFTDPATSARFAAHRKKIHNREMSLKDLAMAEALVFPMEKLRPYAHWITPDIRKKRFNTRFFLASAPARQVPLHDSIEMTASLWIGPQEALERHKNGQLPLMPPTLVTLEELAEITRLSDLFSLIARRDIPTILPQPFSSGETIGLKLPFDPEYSIGEYKMETRTDKPSRLILTPEGWKTVFFKV